MQTVYISVFSRDNFLGLGGHIDRSSGGINHWSADNAQLVEAGDVIATFSLSRHGGDASRRVDETGLPQFDAGIGINCVDAVMLRSHENHIVGGAVDAESRHVQRLRLHVTVDIK